MDSKLVSRLVLVMALCGLAANSHAVDAERDQKGISWGKVIDPDGDCTFVEGVKGAISLTIPGTPHDLSYSPTNSGQNSPRLLRDVAGDFIIRVKVVGDFDPGDEPSVDGMPVFQSAGLLLLISDKHFIRLERDIQRMDNQSYCFAPLLEQWKDEKFVGNTQPVESGDFFKGNSTHLQLERIGNEVTARISHDGNEWISYKPIQVQLPEKVSVGVLGINTSKKPLKVTFEDLMLFVRNTDGT